MILKLPCGCLGELVDDDWVVYAEAFLCADRHMQGERITVETPEQRVAREDHAAEVRLRGEERVAELEKEANR